MAESDEALFEALTAGRARYTEGALRVIVDEASRRGLTRPERMKELARQVKAGAAVSPPELAQSEAGLREFFDLVLQGLAFLATMGALIALRIFLRRLF
jgi:hypothetical protein